MLNYGGVGGGTFGGAGTVIAGTAALTGGNVPYLLWKSFVPIIIGSTGSMGNNGAVTALTAQASQYPNAYLVVPAGAVAAGVPAATDVYFFQMSSTTAGTLFNNRLADNLDANGLPTIPASPTAFATTGPGAFTGVTASVTLLTLSLGAGLMSTGGIFDIELDWVQTSNANAKTFTVTLGGSNVFNAISLANLAIARGRAEVANRLSASSQFVHAELTGSNSVNPQNLYLSVNTANAAAVVVSAIHSGAATDNVVLEGLRAWVTQKN